jgi:nucleoside phosphorylase
VNPILPWLFVAVPRERRAFRHTQLGALRDRPTAIWRCSLGAAEFLLGETGVGGIMVRQTLDWLAQSHTPRFVFLAGFGGALNGGLQVGDAVHASDVISPAGDRYPTTLSFSPFQRRGTLLTSDRLIADPAEKRLLAERHQAHAVDMETSYLAAWCHERGVPWGCVRAVSDDAATPISRDVFEILEAGRVSPWRLTKAIARRPALVRELLHLKRATEKAAETIALALQSALNCPT